MPELPEVETMVRGIREAVEGRQIVEFRKCPCSCKPLTMTPSFKTMRTRVLKQQVIAVRRFAKRIILDLENESSFVIEPRMTGLMLLSDPPDVEHLRLEWRLKKGRSQHSLWFWDRRGLGTVRLYRKAELATALGPDKLGPDALLITLKELKQRCAATSRAIKVALLDQKLVAGIGNLYASEILHVSRIHPECAANRLSDAELQTMHKAIKRILKTAIRYEGSTLGDGTYRNALNQSGSYQNQHRVYSREGEICGSCKGAEIVRMVQAQRSTFYCPCCQTTK
ncbi:bifunctional DNA-formamidopyrimidine glycosylase/DNA-(apurinic or apyrimidinic site) lyase [Gimesia fumaroli]|uniref:Formamidopyrimidine-DNA glycosylase n=1 Tax=Gimesia fumaroli TaxID=2527976 RepID=A0A518IH22_9PLAN|nr:bifunctional DNA-formamidopyrimidine glycosylase/DNA-(apurinic or apyrimidinic site) lyase [Gimesia fumaroli]QDV52388.1 Formamidopyrimidine-DNA glycosylase [Gimesia fumaroli]